MQWLTERWRRLERHADEWAARKMSPDQYAEALELDRRLKRHPWRWIGGFVLVAAGGSLLVRLAWPSVGAGESIFLSTVGAVWLIALVAAPWYGYRKFARQPWKRFAVLVVLAVFGASVGFTIGVMQSSKPIGQILQPERIGRAFGISVLLGLVVASVVLGISRMRLREAEQRGARLAAEAERERFERRTVEADLKLLQAQVEPHFLFNTLANVRQLIQSGSPQALTMMDHLIHYLRTALPDLRSQSTTLGRECELARSYLEIMRMRMGSALRFSVEVDAALANRPFPPLVLMTLVENAIKHGVGPVGGGEIRIRAFDEAGALRVEVIDDGRGLGGSLGQGVGLANIRERLLALYGERARLSIEGTPGAGVVARLEIPA